MVILVLGATAVVVLVAVCLSDICNIVSVSKFHLLLSHSNEPVGMRQTCRQDFSTSQNLESAGIIFMDIYKQIEMEISQIKHS
jgi:hypothetical protein